MSSKFPLDIWGGVIADIVMLLRPSQPENTPHSILVILFGMVTEVKLVQSENAPDKILVTLLGIVIFLSFLQPENT